MQRNAENEEKVTLIFERAVKKYIAERKEKIPSFTRTYLGFKGAWQLNKKAFGLDMLKTPVNILWSVPYIIIKLCAWLLKKLGAKKLSALLNKTSAGFLTKVQKELNRLIITELLELPYKEGDKYYVEKDALLSEIINDSGFSDEITEQLQHIHSSNIEGLDNFRPKLEQYLSEYSTSRMAASEIVGSVLTLSAGAAKGQLTPGAIAAGNLTAAVIAQHLAISNFWLGSTLGSVYYGIFPKTASTGLIVLSIGTIVAFLTIITSFSGIITDPFQQKLGIHQKRLNKFIDALQYELLAHSDSDYKIKDRYIARVFDIFDLLQTIAAKV